MKKYSLIVLALILVSIVSCSHPVTPDDDMASGIILGDMNQVQQALDRGANVNMRYKDGSTPLMSACKTYRSYHGEAAGKVAVEVQVDLKTSKTRANVQARDLNAAHSSQTITGNQAMVELLLARGADVHARDKEGRTALALAIQNNLPEIAEMLRKAGAD